MNVPNYKAYSDKAKQVVISTIQKAMQKRLDCPTSEFMATFKVFEGEEVK